jgi:rubrerythrin/predicted phosphodiesterase
MEYVTTEAIPMPEQGTHGFTLIGDPGCDGLGVEILQVFNAALGAAQGAFVLVAGDIVPNGAKHFYENVVAMVRRTATRPVYMLPGNHDTEGYSDFFGKKNYYLYDYRLLVVVLDNSQRAFGPEALALLARALEACPRENIVLAFHIPPPNQVVENAVPPEEWARVLEALGPHKAKVRYIVCGHIHSYFEDQVEGIPLVATGGGGARIEEVAGVPTPYYHLVEFTFGSDGVLRHQQKDITPQNLTGPGDPAVEATLRQAYANECAAHLRYKLYAEDALRRQKPGLAQLFAAAADSEFYHARNHFFALNQLTGPEAALAESADQERQEVQSFYKDAAAAAQDAGCGLAAYAFLDAWAAEKVHEKLFREALPLCQAQGYIPPRDYHTCTSCGYTFTDGPAVCPVCGAPRDKIRPLTKSTL